MRKQEERRSLGRSHFFFAGLQCQALRVYSFVVKLANQTSLFALNRSIRLSKKKLLRLLRSLAFSSIPETLLGNSLRS